MVRLISNCCLIVFVAFNFGAVNISHAAKKVDEAKEDLSDIKQKINALKKELSSSKEAHHDVADALKESETAISIANKKLRIIAQKQKQKQNTLAQLKKQSLDINANLASQQRQLSRLLYQQYAQGNQSYIRLILQNKSPSQITRDLRYQSYIAKAHADLINDMQASLGKIKALDLKTTTALKNVADLKAKQETEKQELNKQKREKSKVLTKLSKQIAAQRGEIKKLVRDEKRLSKLVKKLARITLKPNKKKSAKASKKTNDVIAKNEAVPDSRYAGVNFASLKGKLKLPVLGDITNRFGSTRPDSGISWKGLFIRANEGADVKSVASGRVVFADWMRGFGNLMIIDHGDGYMSLYGNNQTILRNVGDEVNGGDTIAAVGNSGGNESHGLYYELRSQSKPFDPLSWSITR